MHFLVFYLRGCDKEEVLPNEIACKEVVHLERRNMEHLFCKEWPPPHLVALKEGASSIKVGITCPKFIACSSDTLSMLLSPVLNSFKCLTFLCLHFVIFRQTWNFSNIFRFSGQQIYKNTYIAAIFANNTAAYMSIWYSLVLFCWNCCEYINIQ